MLIINPIYDQAFKYMMDNEEIFHKNDFVQFHTHPLYILQLSRLSSDRKTKLEKFLSFFDQSQKTYEKYLMDLGEGDIEDKGLSENKKISKTSYARRGDDPKIGIRGGCRRRI